MEAVAFLHLEGLCYQDIKLENILIRGYDPPEALLSNFGSALDEKTVFYNDGGTIPYLAPEQQKGSRHD